MNLRDAGSKLAGLFRRERDTTGGPMKGPMSQAARLKVVTEKFNEAKNAADSDRDKWTEWREFYDGTRQGVAHQASADLDVKLQSDFTVLNLVKSSLLTYVATLLQVVPAPFVVAMRGEDEDRARRTTDYLQVYAKDKHIAGELQIAYLDALILGTGAIKAYDEKGQKEVVCAAIDPETVYPDPTATAFERCEYVALRNIYGEGLAERLWPDIDLKKAQPVETPSPPDLDQQVGTGTRIEVIEFYYDFGKKLMVYSGDQVLYDDDNLTPSERYPVFLFQMPKSPRAFWPEGLIPDLMPPQIS